MPFFWAFIFLCAIPKRNQNSLGINVNSNHTFFFTLRLLNHDTLDFLKFNIADTVR